MDLRADQGAALRAARARPAARRRPARGRSPSCAPGVARARMRADARPRRRLRALGGDPHHGRLVAAARCDDQFEPSWASTLFASLHRLIKTLDNDPNIDGAHLGSAYQGGCLRPACRRTCARLLGRRRLRGLRGPPGRGSRLLARLLRRQPSGAAATSGAAAGALARAEGASARRSAAYADEALRRRQAWARTHAASPATSSCFDAVRHPPARRGRAAADPLDQPPDLPAGRRDPAHGAAVRRASRSRVAGRCALALPAGRRTRA